MKATLFGATVVKLAEIVRAGYVRKVSHTVYEATVKLPTVGHVSIRTEP